MGTTVSSFLPLNLKHLPPRAHIRTGKLARQFNDIFVITLHYMNMQNLTEATSNPQHPASYPRRVLLAVSGLSPQIVTETLYALALAEAESRFLPTEVHIITTIEGAQRAELSLLSADLGWFHRLCVDYQLPAIAFNRDDIHVMRDARG